ncbi:hypothetical protein JKF63_04006 [Porcisia hertigi]|uniref:Uncharacterized protein n=1 Tax=Porcisia hertigi TaxID=2761500 RepID=A0A836IL52_9TRYP|nr:hypothetical protein JKF63_04006 [Porcisia hertigi]
MEELAKSVQRAQAAVLGVQNDLVLLRAHVEKGAEEQDAGSIAKAAAAGLDTGVSPRNPYYVELHTTIHQRQEAASLLLQRCAHLFYEQFGVLEERAARLENVRVKEKELQSAKKSMQRYFDAHAKELEEERETHDGALQIEWARREHLEDGIVRIEVERRQQRLAHGVLFSWLKKAMMRNLAREYTRRRDAAREMYQAATCDALVQQQRVTTAQRALFTWRRRIQQRRYGRLEVTATEAEKRAQFFRNELTAIQQTFHERLGRDLGERGQMTTAVSTQEKECAQCEDEVQRLRASLHDMTIEFSERTRTYVRQQEGLEQLFAQKEEALRDTICRVQAMLTTERQAHAAFVESSGYFVSHVNAYWQARLQALDEAARRTEEFAHHTTLGLFGRLQHRYASLLQEAAKLRRDVDTLSPLSERCVRLENELAESEQLLKRRTASSQVWERRCRAAHVVGSLLTDRVAFANSAVLRSRFFVRWLERSQTTSNERLQRSIDILSDKLQAQQREMLAQQQEQSSRHQVEVAQLQDELEQLRRTNIRLQAKLETAARTQRERDSAYCDSEARNGELSAAMLREKIERRGVEDKWWSSRASGLMLQEAQQRLRVEAQEGLWWTALLIRESKTLKVWTASLHCETTQLTTVCEGWQQHCHQLDAAHETVRKSAATRTACALERGLLHAQTLAVWTSWQKWARQRRAVSAVETRSAQSRMEMIRRHGEELTRLHISHDTALQCIQREHAVEKTQLQSIHQERCATLRRVQAEEMERLSEKHAQQLTTTQAAYAAEVAQRDEQADAMQEQLRHMGSLVVEYCAQATYTRWRAWAAVRQAQRAALQHRELVRQMSEWHTASAMMADASVAAKLVLCMSALTEAVQKSAVDVRRWGQHLEQEQELCHSQIHKLQAVKESVEEEATHLRGELHHVRMLYDAEAHYTDQLLRTAKAEHRARRSALTFTARMAEWQEWVFCSSADYLAAAMRVFTDAARQLISEVLATHRVESSSHVAQVVGEEAGLTTRPHEAVALLSADVNTKDVPISDGDGVADVSGCALDLYQGGPNHVEVSTGCSGGPSSTTRPITVAQSPVKVIPKRLLLRLRSVESCLRDPGDTCGAEHEANDTASEKCRRFLSESFLEELTPTSSWPSAIACQQVEQADAPLVVCHLLEIVRLAALRGASTRNREHAAELAAIEAKRERSEEALGGLQESMEGLLAEQRTFAEEMHAHAQQQSQYPVTGESTSAQTLLMWAETWKERLGALTDRYAQVLEVFHADITRRQERSCSVNSLLMEVDAFSKVLLQRFAENVSAMAQLQQHLLAKASGEAALRDGCGSSDTNLPTNAAAAVETIRDSSPKPKPAPPLTTATLSPLHPDSAHHAASVQVSDSGVTASAQGSVLSADSLPEMRSLRDRVQLLERLLVETKVQLAEAKSLAGVPCGASYIPKASAQAQLWAAQDAEDFEQLGLTKEQLLVLYGASESMTRTLMMAMREYEVKLHVTQSATAQQLRTACAAVEETLQARHRADVEHYEAKLRTLSESLAEATQEKFIAAARHGELVQQLKTEAANWAEKYTRDTELTRQSRLHEVNELADHQRLLKDELERCRRATESCVQQAVDRQTELLRSEHAEKLRRAEGDVARLTTERELLSGRLRGLEADCEQRVQQERAAVVRLPHQLAGVVGVDAVLSSVSTCASWGVTFLDTMELFASYAADKAAWFAVCATLLMDCERDQWETEVLQLREHVTQLLDVSHVSPEVPVPVRGSHQGSRNVQIDGRITSPYDKVEEDSLQALTLSPSPRRNNQGMSAGDKGGRITACDATAQHTSARPASSLEAAQTPREAKGVQVVDGPTTTPTRCRSLSLGSLELSQSVLRFSKMLSDQRTRNATRLERASVLIADIDDLLLHGAQLTESAALKSARWNIKAVKGEGGGERE